ncbi:MAG: hypothetical protein KGH60_01970 [Candidatus Micrarchaeota archaeon]|nr:hypothetical protein [Candidatus Micrarchaeota archaeon]
MDKGLIFVGALTIIALAALTSAANVNMVEPYNATLQNNGTVYLGKVGPGQTFFVTISAATQNQSGVTLPLGWNQFLASSLPSGWLAANSSLYNQQLSIRITTAPNAANGTYGFNLTAVNVGNYSKLGSVRFRAYVNVTPNVFVLTVHPTTISTGPGQPASIYVTINNTGVSDSPFVINMHNLPAWNNSYTVIAQHHTSQNFIYPVYEGTPGVYDTQLYVSSLASPLVFEQSNVQINVQASLANDYSALGQGVLGFPTVYEPAYAVMYLISLIFKH